MDDHFIHLFEEELTHVRRMGEEFRFRHPQVAERLQLGMDPPDPYVQQLLDGFAFLAARVRRKLEGEYPLFTSNFLDNVIPGYQGPKPSMAIVELEPDFDNAELAQGPVIPRGTRLQGKLEPGDTVRCVYTTAHKLQLSPIQLVEARYYSQDLDQVDRKWASRLEARSAIVLRLRCTAGLKFNQLAIDALPLFIRPSENLAAPIFELLNTSVAGVVLQETGKRTPPLAFLEPGCLRPLGFDREEALLPQSGGLFSGYRLLQEYFLFPFRFLFMELSGLAKAFAACSGSEIELVFALNKLETRLERRLNGDCFRLHCTPAINLFRQENIVVDLRREFSEHHVVVDRTKALDYEVVSIDRVVGRPKGASKPDDRCQFFPFYFSSEKALQGAGRYSFTRHKRRLSDLELRHGPASEYLGSDVFLCLTEGRADLEVDRVFVSAWCSNRHLPLRKPSIDFELDVGAPVSRIHTLLKSAPRTVSVEGDQAWRAVAHLSVHIEPMLSETGEAGAAVLRELLRLYAPADSSIVESQIAALRSAKASPAFRRVPGVGPISFARGVDMVVSFEEDPYKEGTGLFLLGSILNEFFARYATLNSFVHTTLESKQRGMIHSWPVRKGQRSLL